MVCSGTDASFQWMSHREVGCSRKGSNPFSPKSRSPKLSGFNSLPSSWITSAACAQNREPGDGFVVLEYRQRGAPANRVICFAQPKDAQRECFVPGELRFAGPIVKYIGHKPMLLVKLTSTKEGFLHSADHDRRRRANIVFRKPPPDTYTQEAFLLVMSEMQRGKNR